MEILCYSSEIFCFSLLGLLGVGVGGRGVDCVCWGGRRVGEKKNSSGGCMQLEYFFCHLQTWILIKEQVMPFFSINKTPWIF